MLVSLNVSESKIVVPFGRLQLLLILNQIKSHLKFTVVNSAYFFKVAFCTFCLLSKQPADTLMYSFQPKNSPTHSANTILCVKNKKLLNVLTVTFRGVSG